MNNLAKLDVFVKRMDKLNIKIKLIGNYPWIYIGSVNGNRISSKDYFDGNHGFTIGYLPIKPDQKFEFTDITKIFQLIRKYR